MREFKGSAHLSVSRFALESKLHLDDHMATKKSASYKGKAKVRKVMEEHKEGKLKSGSGKKVASRKQAVAIALSEARKSGADIPPKKKKS